MFSINDLKIGTKIIFNSEPHQVIYTEHSKLGRGGGILRTKIKNLISGATLEKTFAGAEKIQEAELETKKAQYLYKDAENFYFMDAANFEQFSISLTQIGKMANFLKEGAEVDILYFQNKPINIQLPIKITLEITYTEPGFKGNTASTVLKPATLETGAQINVPLFIKDGDKIVIDTRTGAYVERA
ncbi:MAG: elongation factor P [Patescibacteria group bacterium]|nr:elongation factor P [Patescibacteria group bacterium]